MLIICNESAQQHVKHVDLQMKEFPPKIGRLGKRKLLHNTFTYSLEQKLLGNMRYCRKASPERQESFDIKNFYPLYIDPKTSSSWFAGIQLSSVYTAFKIEKSLTLIIDDVPTVKEPVYRLMSNFELYREFPMQHMRLPTQHGFLTRIPS